MSVKTSISLQFPPGRPNIEQLKARFLPSRINDCMPNMAKTIAMSFESANQSKPGSFPTTQWNLVDQANTGSEEEAKRALEELCLTYWHPIYIFLRGKNYSKTDAEDLTQGFFSSLLHRESLNRVDSERGKLRTFLLADLKRFIADETRRQSAIKRGGHVSFTALENDALEEELAISNIDPESLYMKAWALTLIEGTTECLRQTYIQSGKGDVFELISDHLYGKKSGIPYSEIALRLKTSISAARLTVFRLRQKFRSQLEKEIAHTVESPEEVETEIEYLIQVVTSQQS